MLEALLVGLDRPVHHRRGRAKAGPMRVAHDAEPLVGCRLAVAVQVPADPVHENLRAAAGYAVQARRDQPIDHCRDRQLREARKMNDLRRRKRVQLEIRIALLDRAEQILVPLQRQVGIMTTLQQELRAADGQRFVDLPEHLVESEHVPVWRSDGPIKRAEVAPGDADVRVIDVAVDDVGDDALGMLAGANPVGEARREAASRRADTARALRQRPRRPPPRTFAAICSIVMVLAGLKTCAYDASDSLQASAGLSTCMGQHRRYSLDLPVETQIARRRDHADFRRVAIEQLEAGAFAVAKIVLDIIAQVSRADFAMLGRLPEIVPRDGLRLSHAGITRRPQCRHIIRAEGAWTTGPERPDKRKAGHRRPRFAQVDLDNRVRLSPDHIHGSVAVRSVRLQPDRVRIRQQRLVADDQRRVARAGASRPDPGQTTRSPVES